MGSLIFWSIFLRMAIFFAPLDFSKNNLDLLIFFWHVLSYLLLVQIEKVVEEDLQAGKIKEVTDQLMAQINQFTVQTAFTGTGETLQFRLSYNATDTLKFGENLSISEVALILNM